jgi:hypothetical protein
MADMLSYFPTLKNGRQNNSDLYLKMKFKKSRKEKKIMNKSGPGGMVYVPSGISSACHRGDWRYGS